MMIFDPILILYQIVTLQCFYYFAYGSLLIICHTVLDFNISLDYYFTPKYVNFTSLIGWIQTICILMSSLAGAYLLSIIVEKSKKCVDFTFTLYFIHITVCCLYYQQVPFDWEWWITHVFASVIMASLGEYICSRNELEDIPLYNPNT